MSLSTYVCENCGFWQRWFAEPPSCIVCTDVRNDLPEDGWSFAPLHDVARGRRTTWREAAPGIIEFRTTPGIGLDGCGWLVLRSGGNIAYECAAFYDDASLAHIASLGGIAWLSTSHPHGTGALWQLQDRFAPRVPLHRDGLPWSKAFRVTDPYDDTLDLGEGAMLRHIGGHYEGHALLYVPERRALFCGDALKLDFDTQGRTRALSAHKAYHKAIPLTHNELRCYRDAFAAFAFDRVYTPFDSGDVSTADALAFYDTQLASRPTTQPLPLR